MTRPCCHTCLAFILKFLNFLQTFLGISITIYSVYMLNHWNKHSIPPSRNHLSNFNSVGISDLGLAASTLTGSDDVLNSLPAPWFIYAFMGVGVVLCCVVLLVSVTLQLKRLMDVAFVLYPFPLPLFINFSVLSSLIAIILRAMVSAARVDPDDDRDYEVGGRTWEPLLHPQHSKTSATYKGDARDIWSSRMRKKVWFGWWGSY